MKRKWSAFCLVLLLGLCSFARAETDVTFTYTDQVTNPETEFSQVSALMSALEQAGGKKVRLVLNKPLDLSGQALRLSGPAELTLSGEALKASQLELTCPTTIEKMSVYADQVYASGQAFTLGEGAHLSGNGQAARLYGANAGTDGMIAIAGEFSGTVYGGSNGGTAGDTVILVEKTGTVFGNLFGGGYLVKDQATGGVNNVHIQIDGRVTARAGADNPTGLVFAGSFVRGAGVKDELLGDSVITVSGQVEGSVYGGSNVAGKSAGDRASGYHRGKSQIKLTSGSKVVHPDGSQYSVIGGGWANERADVINHEVYLELDQQAQAGHILGGGYADSEENNVSDVNSVVMELDGKAENIYAGGAALAKTSQAKVNGGSSIRFAGESRSLVGTGVSQEGSDTGILSGGAKLVISGGKTVTISGFSGVVVSRGSTMELLGTELNQEGKTTVKGKVQLAQAKVAAGEIELEKGRLYLPAGGQLMAKQITGSGRIGLSSEGNPEDLRITGISDQADITLAMDGYALEIDQSTAKAVPIQEEEASPATPLDQEDSPDTGDLAQGALWVCLLGASLACLLLIIRKRKQI